MSLSCNQLRDEAQRVSDRAATAAGEQTKARGRDAAMVGVSLLVFWPAAFFIGGDRGSARDIAQLKGEMQAIQQANTAKHCGIQFAQQ